MTEFFNATLNGSRSTWACELKFSISAFVLSPISHAPRERVSWNPVVEEQIKVINHVTLHVSVWVEIDFSDGERQERGSRSTWACELKLAVHALATSPGCHAPRERVSWNSDSWRCYRCQIQVTLHVSVWVEMKKSDEPSNTDLVTLHVSVWVEIMCVMYAVKFMKSHAPRERVSWNEPNINQPTTATGHAPRERVSWNYDSVQPYVEYKSHAPRERVSWNYYWLIPLFMI